MEIKGPGDASRTDKNSRLVAITQGATYLMNSFRFVFASVFAVSLVLLPSSGYSSNGTPATSPPASAQEGASLLAGKRVMVLGDSITQGGGYVTFIEYLLEKRYPVLSFDIVSVGLSSETTSVGVRHRLGEVCRLGSEYSAQGCGGGSRLAHSDGRRAGAAAAGRPEFSFCP